MLIYLDRARLYRLYLNFLILNNQAGEAVLQLKCVQAFLNFNSYYKLEQRQQRTRRRGGPAFENLLTRLQCSVCLFVVVEYTLHPSICMERALQSNKYCKQYSDGEHPICSLRDKSN